MDCERGDDRDRQELARVPRLHRDPFAERMAAVDERLEQDAHAREELLALRAASAPEEGVRRERDAGSGAARLNEEVVTPVVK